MIAEAGGVVTDLHGRPFHDAAFKPVPVVVGGEAPPAQSADAR